MTKNPRTRSMFGILMSPVALIALICACAGPKGDTGESTWDEGVYHVTVALDTADGLSETDNGDTAIVNDIAAVVRDQLYLRARQYDDEFHCSGYPLEADLVVEMRAWVREWSANLLLPARATCFYVGTTVNIEEIEIDNVYGAESINCGANSGETSIHSNDGEVENVSMLVGCNWYRPGECEDEDC